MSRLTNERGFLNYEGIIATETLREQLRIILATQDNEINMRTLGCALKSLVTEETSVALLKVRIK
jgi:phage baseplate assembly protein W